MDRMSKKVIGAVAGTAVVVMLGVAGIKHYIDAKTQEVKETGAKVVKAVDNGAEKIKTEMVEVKTATLVTAKELNQTIKNSEELNATKNDIKEKATLAKQKLANWLTK